MGKVLSNHILRVAPGSNIRSGYLQCALGHPVLGRPRIVRFAFGHSVPELAADDIATASVPRVGTKIEDSIADLVEEAAAARDLADQEEQALGSEAESLVDRFLASDTVSFSL